ncbi:Uncharacterised protein [Mycobacteroides abscessus subsp. bolletii]|uniref:hypothetical protein n=1 Tax=Mycobacteroides abscessus TaxID=36809 RepID=UPI0009A8AA86|nr:hypothetical protein [Mycobacteroides abscessus]SKS74044.1 Uncharacterised protein [Mycobacteroides abscessus subsp. bolletii]SKS82714.1 Uncharacterised protein [Mycobacteroides abscessus subsp. bolletii]
MTAAIGIRSKPGCEQGTDAAQARIEPGSGRYVVDVGDTELVIMRSDETQYRLLERTYVQSVSEPLAAQVLMDQGYTNLDPIHPFGGPDGGRDGECQRDGKPYVMAVYFPRGKKGFGEVKKKFVSDADKAVALGVKGIAFVTNQEILMSERTELTEAASGLEVEIYHLERVAAILNQPSMSQVRREFLGIEAGPVPFDLALSIEGAALCFLGSDEVREILLDGDDQARRQDAEEKRKPKAPDPFGSAIPLSAKAGLFWGQTQDEPPPSVEELDQILLARRERIQRQWARCEDYLAAHVGVPISFIVTNSAQAFLHDVQLVVTVAGARGVELEAPGDFNYEQFLDPEYTAPPGPLGVSLGLLQLPRRPDHPVQWRNRGDTLQITIELPTLRPQQVWETEAEGDDLVVVTVNAQESLSISWTATARSYGTVYTGADLTMSVQQQDLAEAVEQAIDAL